MTMDYNLEPRCEHVTDQPASKCRDCQHGEPLRAWREYWARRRRNIEWTVTPHLRVLGSENVEYNVTTIEAFDPTTGERAKIDIPWFALYLADAVMQGVLYCERQLFTRRPSITKEQFDYLLSREHPVTKEEAIRRALETETFIVRAKDFPKGDR